MTDVTGRTAFITGGANGIGLGIARVFGAAGVKLALADLDSAALERAKAELSATTEVHTSVLDVRDRAAFADAADAAEANLGPVSLLFNNAGVAGGAPAARLTYALWDWGLGINLGGVVNGVQTFLPRMVARGQGGHIVNTASGAGLAATTSGTLYCTSKFAVVGMSEALRSDLKTFSIGVSVLCPGPVATDIVSRSSGTNPTVAEMTDEQRKTLEERNTAVTAFLHQGASIEAVGAMVLDAVRQDRLYIHTDRIMADLVKARTKEILDAMPPA